MPVQVRNLKTGPSVFSIPEERIQIEWLGAGDPSGGDVQEVPDSLMQNTNFRRAIIRGIFAEVSNEEGQAALEQQTRAYLSQQAGAAAGAVSSIDPAAKNDLISLPCQGPTARGTGECGQPVAIRETKAAEAPVLCSQHTHLAPEFVSMETGTMLDKGDHLEPEVRWVRSTLAPREIATTR